MKRSLESIAGPAQRERNGKAKVLKSENDSLTRDKVRDSGGFVVSVLNYNIDGLGVDLSVRTNACIDIILKQNADIVTLQEVIDPIRDLLIFFMDNAGYKNASGCETPSCKYYTMMFVKTHFSVLDSRRVPFRKSQSRMGRDILISLIKSSNTKFEVLTSHLESTKEHFSTRCKQLKEIYDDYLFRESSGPVIFCGDTNLSFNVKQRVADEVFALGSDGLSRIDDAYKVSRAPTAFSSTWARRFGPPGGKTVRCRFDRFYSNRRRVQVISFDDGGFYVTGKEGIEGVNSAVSGYDTPSDHFAVIVKYGIFPSPQSYKNTSTDISRLPKKEMRAKRLLALTGRPDKGDGNLRVEKISSEASKSVISYDTNQQCNASTKVFWRCSACTFHNYNMKARECEICHSGRDSNV